MVATEGGGETARLQKLFHRLLELHGEARESFLAESGATEAERARLAILLEAHESAGDFLLDPTSGGRPENAAGLKPGERLGCYRLLDEIGEGGFGIVFRAEQREPVHRTVAIKVLKPGMDTRQVIARFEAERQALALMDHPNIARVIEAGATASGHPYFAMEFVEGEPITGFCDANGLAVIQRLNLFLDVCHAVQHAHQKGVIHRDLKPSNVLVADNDGRPLPKIIDFGIAKATGPSMAGRTVMTQMTELMGTPAYVSPEQIELSVLGVDTRADIYSLGVLLYELLTGTTPLDAKTLSGRSLADVRHLILDHNPPRPSTRVWASKGTDGRDYSRTHGSSASALRFRLAGDLDWIVMKALEKDRTRRYATAGEFAQDISRHLANLPVEAGPPGTWYRAGKFIHRHRAAVAAAAAALVALLGGLTVALVGMIEARTRANEARISEDRAHEQGRRAREVTELVKRIFESVEPSVGATYTVRQLLDAYSQDTARELVGDPLVESELRLTIGRTYLALGEYRRADSQLQRVLEISRQLHGENSTAVADARHEIGLLRSAQSDHASAVAEFSTALSIREAEFGPAAPGTLATRAALAETHLALNDLDAAGAGAREVRARASGASADSAESRAAQLSAQATLSSVAFRSGARDVGVTMIEQVAADAVRHLGGRHPVTRLAANRRVVMRTEFGQTPGRQREFEEQLRTIIVQFGIAHPDTLRQTIDQLQALTRSGQDEEARRRMRDVITAVKQTGGLAVGDPQAPLTKLVGYAARAGRLADFESFLGPGTDLAKRLFHPGESEFSWFIRVAAHVSFHLHRLDESERTFREAVAASFAEGAPGFSAAAESVCFLADVLAPNGPGRRSHPGALHRFTARRRSAGLGRRPSPRGNAAVQSEPLA